MTAAEADDLVRARDLVRSARRIAVVGASPNPARPSHGVMRYLLDAGYEVVPVRPGGVAVHGVPAAATLAEAARGGPLDIVDIFRHADALPPLVPELLAIRPRLVWFQLGVRNDAVAATLRDAGLVVVQDHCLKIEHRRWGI